MVNNYFELLIPKLSFLLHLFGLYRTVFGYFIQALEKVVYIVPCFVYCQLMPVRANVTSGVVLGRDSRDEIIAWLDLSVKKNSEFFEKRELMHISFVCLVRPSALGIAPINLIKG